MRQLSEIDKDITEIDEKINALHKQRKILSDERRERKFTDFCYKYGVKKGDVVHTDYYGDMMVCGMATRWDSYILVRKIKKNGEPYSVFNTQSENVFEGCKVIGHIDDKTIED